MVQRIHNKQRSDPRTDADKQIMAFEIRGLFVDKGEDNPCISDAEEILEEFLSEMYGKKTKDVHNLSGFTSLLYKKCINKEKLILINYWFGFGFILDDFLDKQLDDKCVDYWKNIYNTGRSEGSEPLDKMFNKVMQIMANYMNEDMINRHKYYCCRWLELYRNANQWKAGRVEELTYGQYINIRRQDTLYEVMLQFAEMAVGFDLNEFEFLKSDTNLQKLNDFCGLHIILVNDLYSCKKEVKQRQGKFNYVYLKMKTEAIGAQQAVDSIVAQIIETQRLAEYYAKELNKYGIKSLDDYCEEALHVIRGNHYWSSVCRRYNDLSLYDH